MPPRYICRQVSEQKREELPSHHVSLRVFAGRGRVRAARAHAAPRLSRYGLKEEVKERLFSAPSCRTSPPRAHAPLAAIPGVL